MVGPLSRKGCFKCGDLSHIAENCTSATRLCYNCKSPDHESSACPNPRSAESKQCYGCGGIGHLAADCPTLRASGFGAGGPKCYACGNMGHIARNCPTGAPTLDGQVNPVAVGGAVPLAARGGRGGLNGARGLRGGFRGRAPGIGAAATGRVVRCYACGQLNHLAKSCTAVPAANAPGIRGPKTCYKCQETGHIARDCPTNEQAIVA